MKSSTIVSIAGLCLFGLGCAPTTTVAPPGHDAGQDDAGQVSSPDAGGTCTGTVAGTVRFPNGVEPMPGAMVYALPTGAPLPARGGTCGQCIEYGAVNSTDTGSDGKFSLSLPPGRADLVIEKGPFRRRVPIDVRECDETLALNDDDIRLPRDGSEGDVPRIAVVTGDFDEMENVLALFGLGDIGSDDAFVPGTGIIDLYAGSLKSTLEQNIETLLRDPERLASYDVVLINCGNDYEQALLSDGEVVGTLRDYVTEGGRLYVTDHSYEYVEAPFPDKIAFLGQESQGLSMTPEPFDASQLGDEIAASRRGDVPDPGLADWLRTTRVLRDDNQVDLEGFDGDWNVMSRVSTDVTQWIVGAGDWSYTLDLSQPEESARTIHAPPMTVMFDHGCGRVLYSSYHALGLETHAAGTPLLAQERVLGYLLFEIATCVQDAVIN